MWTKIKREGDQIDRQKSLLELRKMSQERYFSSQAGIMGKFYQGISCSISMILGKRVYFWGWQCSTCDFGSVDDVTLNKSRNVDFRELGESVLWILTCPRIREKTMSHVPKYALYEKAASDSVIEH